MPYNPDIHKRKSIRLKGYDYSCEGFYFITICIHSRELLFGNITDGIMKLNDAGKLVEKEWINLKNRFCNIELHDFIIMPNHFHAILEISVGATLVVAPDMIAPDIKKPATGPGSATTRVAPTDSKKY